MARLGSTSREMAPVAREEMQAFMDRNPCYDLLTDFGEIGSGERLRAALHAVTHFPYPADQDRSEQILRRYGRLAARIPSLPRAQRFEAFTAVLNCATRYSGDMAFRVVARLTNDLGCLPEDLRALALPCNLAQFDCYAEASAAGCCRSSARWPYGGRSRG